MDQRIINLYDSFTHGYIHRREFLDRLTQLTGSTAAATALLPLLHCDYAKAATVPENDARLAIDRMSYDSPKGKINGYLARPKDKGKRPAVIVIHQNRGLNPHIEDVARRVALDGFLAFAPDLLSVNGGTPPSDDQARELHAKTDREAMIAASIAAVPFMKAHAESTGKVGATGFCFGGGVVNRMAAGAFVLAFQARTLDWKRTKEAVFLTAKTTAMVCWLFVGSALFSGVFAILGGQALIELSLIHI